MLKLALTTALTLAAGQAVALSCIQPDPVRDFQQASDAEETYVVLYGTFEFDQSKMPQGVEMGDPRTPAPVASIFSGNVLTLDGFVPAPDIAVTLVPTCAGPWCGAMQTGPETLAFVVQGEEGFTLDIGPCGGGIYPEPSRAVLDQMTSCLRGEACEEGATR